MEKFEKTGVRKESFNDSDSIHGRAICEFLVEAKKLDLTNVERALRLQQEQVEWEKIGSILVKLGLVSEHDLVDSLSRQTGLPIIDKAAFQGKLPNGNKISSKFLKDNKTLILSEADDSLSVAMADPQDAYVLDALHLFSGKKIEAQFAVSSEIEAALENLYSRSEEARDNDRSAQFMDDVEQLKELAGEAPVIKFVNQLIHKAAESSSSDIHIEPFEGQLKVRLRIDGLLREVDSPPSGSAAAIISRVKIMANLNIAERRLAQDGRFKHRVRGKDIDLRVSTVPTMYGESVVLRLLQTEDVSVEFGSLGFSPDNEKTMRHVLEQPHGILLVTGPTGSGKSTTLYAALKHLNSPQRMIITVEDPVEYNIPGVNQMQVKPQIGLTFATALRSIVRQDPDVIMIGEMRDTETARIAVQSALTGHLVLSTLHTNDAASSIMRLLDMRVEDYLLTSAVNAIEAQRLVRMLCTDCREPYTPTEEVVKRFALKLFAGDEPITLYRATGCELCGDTGYVGRTAILEVLVMSEAIKQLVLQRADVGEISRAASSQGMISMRDDGLRKVVAGETTIEEVLRVTAEQLL